MRLGFQPLARAHPVQATVEVGLGQVRRAVARPAGAARLNPREAGLREEPDRILLTDAIVGRGRRQHGLRGIDALDVAHAQA